MASHTVPKGELAACRARILARYKARQLRSIPPQVPCNRCGADCWQNDYDGGFYCFICSNRAMYVDGEFVQGAKEGPGAVNE